MSGQQLSERQRQIAAAASAAAEEIRRDGQARHGRPVEPGDRYTLAATAAWPVEWVLLERHPRHAAFRAVVGDVHPFVGSADLRVPSSALCLRLGASVWVEERDLEPGRRVGAVDRLTVERARQKLLAAAREPAAGDPGEVDDSPEYADWMEEVVRPALAAAGSREAGEEPAPASPRHPGRSPLSYAVAAGIFFLLALGLAVRFGRQQAEIGRLAALAETAEGARQRERSLLAEERLAEQRGWQRQLAAQQAAATALERRLAEIEKNAPRLPEALLNVPVAILNATELERGEAPPINRIERGAAPYLTVVLNLDDTTAYDGYRVVATRRGTAAPVWQGDGLTRTARGLQLALERGRVPPGTYHFQVFGLRQGKAQPLAVYDLLVT